MLGEDGRYGEWERAGIIPREVFAARRWRAASSAWRCPRQRRRGREGLPLQPRDRRGDTARRRRPLRPRLTLQNDICLPYFLAYCDERAARALAARDRLRRADHRDRHDRAGDRLGPRRDVAPARSRDGEHYVVNGAKTFITNGINADLVIVAAKTDAAAAPPRDQPARRGARHGGLRARAQPREDRPARPGHRRAVLRRRARARRRTCSERRARASSTWSSTCPRSACRSPRRRVAAAEAALGWTLDYVQGAHRLSASRSASFQNIEVRAGRAATRGRGRAGVRRPVRRRRSTPAS